MNEHQKDNQFDWKGEGVFDWKKGFELADGSAAQNCPPRLASLLESSILWSDS